MRLIETILANAAAMARLRRDLHAHPELCFHEQRTADVIARQLTDWGIPIHRGLGTTGVVGNNQPAATLSPVSRWALACTALPFCGLALTEAERVRLKIVAQVESALSAHGVLQERISLRIAGCPNGCSRPYAGDIGLVGRVPGQYALFVGGDFAGTRLSFKLLEKVPFDAIGATLEPLFGEWVAARRPGEGFGDYCNRVGPAHLQGLIEA